MRDAEGYLLRPNGTRDQRSVRMIMATGLPQPKRKKDATSEHSQPQLRSKSLS